MKINAKDFVSGKCFQLAHFFQLFLILNVACTHAFIPVFLLLSHFCVQLYMLDNTTLFPVALFSLRFFFFLGMNCVSKLLDKAV